MFDIWGVFSSVDLLFGCRCGYVGAIACLGNETLVGDIGLKCQFFKLNGFSVLIDGMNRNWWYIYPGES